MSEPMKELKVEDPTPFRPNSAFSLFVPENLDLDANMETLRWHIEFRRKCMNQGFDNLLELLERTRQTMKADAAAKETKP